ncbi:MAG: metallophosphoesterase family protein [Segniliparus sp.]|uniref:metallophosphoesterase family protein n=1 Tax=Segniliparus sp. TaxID=2804064 RepID=UPI003F33DDC5
MSSPRSVKFLHTADWQLGMTRHFLDEDAQSRYTAARLAAIGSIGALAAREGCEFVVVCGDVFESNQLAPATVSRALEAMRQAGADFYLLPGNHDPLSAGSIYTSAQFLAERPPNVTVLDSTREVRPGVVLVAAPWRVKRPGSSLVAEALAEAGAGSEGELRVLVAHGGVDVLVPDASMPGMMRLADLERAPVHYVALGDRHSTTKVADRVWYSGSPEATNFDDVETDSGAVLVVELDGDRAHVEPRRVGRWRFSTLRHDMSSGADVAILEAALAKIPDKDAAVLRLALRGALSVAERASLDEVLERHGRLFASVKLWQRHTELATMPADGEFAGFTGFVGEAVAELSGQARSGSGDAQRALGLLLRLSSGQGDGA